jgi:hypothetical protein
VGGAVVGGGLVGPVVGAGVAGGDAGGVSVRTLPLATHIGTETYRAPVNRTRG